MFFSIGTASGDFDLSAESAFSNPQNPKERLWVAEVSDVLTSLHMPQLSVKFGGWKGWQGLEMELSYIGQKIPSQIVYYDSHGQIYIPPTNEFPVPAPTKSAPVLSPLYAYNTSLLFGLALV